MNPVFLNGKDDSALASVMQSDPTGKYLFLHLQTEWDEFCGVTQNTKIQNLMVTYALKRQSVSKMTFYLVHLPSIQQLITPI